MISGDFELIKEEKTGYFEYYHSVIENLYFAFLEAFAYKQFESDENYSITVRFKEKPTVFNQNWIGVKEENLASISDILEAPEIIYDWFKVKAFGQYALIEKLAQELINELPECSASYPCTNRAVYGQISGVPTVCAQHRHLKPEAKCLTFGAAQIMELEKLVPSTKSTW